MLGKVSLITPCYNGKQFEQLYISNIQRQDYPFVEVIFVNDGSTCDIDSMVVRIKEMVLSKGYEFLYLTKENGGAASAVNMALQYATGDYLMLLDMDDELYDKAVSAKAELLNCCPNIDLVINNGYYKFEDKRRKSCPFVKGKKVVPEEIFERILCIDFYNWPGSYMVRSSTFFEVNEGKEIYMSPYGQNMQIMIPAAYRKNVFFIDEYLMNYYVRKNSVSHTDSNKRMIELLSGYETIREKVVKKICKDEQERAWYVHLVKVAATRQKLKCVCRLMERVELEELYRELQKLNGVRFRDYLAFVCGKYYPFTLVYKMVLHVVERLTNRVI